MQTGRVELERTFDAFSIVLLDGAIVDRGLEELEDRENEVLLLVVSHGES